MRRRRTSTPLCRHLRLVVGWKGTIIAETIVAPGKPVYAGLTKRARLRWPVADPGGYDTRIVTWENDGSAVLSVPGMEGGSRVDTQGNSHDLQGSDVVVEVGEWGVCRAGVFAVFFQWVVPPVVEGGRRRINWNGLALGAGVTWAHVIALMIVFAQPPPPRPTTFEIPEFVQSILVDDPPEPVEELLIEQAEEDVAEVAEVSGLNVPSDDTRLEIDDDRGGDDQALGTGTPTEGGGESDLIGALDQGMEENAALAGIFGQQSAGFDTNIGDFVTAGVGEGEATLGGPVGSGRFGPPGGGRGPGTGPGQQREMGGVPSGDGRPTRVASTRRAEVGRIHENQIRPSGNGLAQSEIARVVSRHSRGLRYCYERELTSADAPDGGRVTAQWTIDLQGQVAQVQIVEDTLGSQNVSSCVLAELRQMRFPAPDGAMVVVSYPFMFRSAE